MTRAQRRVLLVAGALVVLMLLFPPWETHGGRYLGHSPIPSPPGHEDYRPEAQRWALPAPDPIGRVSVPLLALQYAALLLCTGAAFVFLGPRGKGEDEPDDQG